MSQNTRHVPNLEAARECMNQAINAAKASDPDYLDQCVTAALQYLQPDEQHVKTTDDEPLVCLHLGIAGEEGTVMTKPMPLPQGVQEIERLNILSYQPDGFYLVDHGDGRHPVSYSARSIKLWFLAEHETNPPF